MDGHNKNAIEAELKKKVDLAYARLVRRREELEAAMGGASCSDEYRKGLVRYAEAGMAAAIEELEYALRQFQVFVTTGVPLEEGRIDLKWDKKPSIPGDE